ncbi:MAG: ATP-sensitive inward rectifier potassium channel 10 [Stigonema ocellatum SAG 48.90 = DSM 106950]|nr:ATP-sensitive inward rectifier potassium channel 10 [Stigonema ocellatum SAG 48.90 = DSM 106950]
MRDGRFEVMGTGAWYSYWRDPYHLLLTIPWSGFLGIMGLLYVATNALFALAYMAGGNCIETAQADSFGNNFFFSVQTLSNIGYGAMYPKTIYANTVVMIESMAGILEVAVLTGLSFARFAQPTARVLFSRVAVIAPQDGVPTLMFRSANKRRNQILEAQLQVYLMRDECTAEGQFIRRIYDLKLLRNQTPSFTLSWTAMHPIDESSPLYGMTPESMMATTSSIVISLSGIDQTVVQLIHARHTYSPHEILWNHRFVDIFFHTPDGNRYMDYNYFHDVVPLDFGD